jgi:chaperone BCS1
MIITSNHYDKLDPALVRPGRIDLTLEMTNVTHNIIREVYEKWFGSKIDENILTQIEDNFYSPAELINIYVSSNNDPTKFLDRLLLNTHV